jgi:hypothetical protein
MLSPPLRSGSVGRLGEPGCEGDMLTIPAATSDSASDWTFGRARILEK